MSRGRLLLVLLVVVALVWLGRSFGAELPRFARWVQSLGMWGPVAYIGAYVIACIAFVPGAVPTMLAGALFGLGPGTLYAFIGETLGGVAAFLVARTLARPLVEHRIAGTARFVALDRVVAERGLRIVMLLRLSPIFPFNFLNYALGITNVRLLDYTLASVAMLPGAFLYVYYGKLAGDVARVASGAPVERNALSWVLLGVGLVATVVATTMIARLASRTLRTAESESA